MKKEGNGKEKEKWELKRTMEQEWNGEGMRWRINEVEKEWRGKE